MLPKLHYWWQAKRSSFWFVPAVMVLDAVVLATLLITLDATVEEIAEAAERTIDAPHDRIRLGNRLTQVREVLATAPVVFVRAHQDGLEVR